MVLPGSNDAEVMAYKYWDYMHSEFQKFAEENNVKFWDMTYAKPELWNKTIRSWADNTHVSLIGAKELTVAVSKLIKDTGDTSHYFYSSYDEYLRTVDIANVWIEKTDNGIKANCTYGMKGRPLFKFYGSKNSNSLSSSDKWELIKDYSGDPVLDRKYYLGKYSKIKAFGKLDTGKLERYSVIEIE